MKIGILTNYNGPNYGAMLQAFALRRKLEDLGHKVVFLRSIWNLHWYVPLWKCFYGWNLHGVRSKFRDHFRYPITAFSAGFPETAPLPDFAAHVRATSDLDAVIVGSDQVWNPRWVLPWIDIQFLGFAPDSCRKIAYAASFSVDEWGDEKRQETGSLLRRFDAISVRETNGERIVRSLCGRNARTVLDPVLLHDAEFYRSFSATKTESDDKSFFTYFAGSTPVASEQRCIKAMREIWPDARHESDKIPIGRGPFARLTDQLGISGAVPVADWLGLIDGASFVLSDSFHGTAFSILFHRPFAVRLFEGCDRGMNQRILSLLDILGLRHRVFTDESISRLSSIVASPIDWKGVDALLAEQREKSVAFLESVLPAVKP